MPTAAFANLGCKVNQYEIEKIAESFAIRGFEIADFSEPADVYVINTCSVTSAADRKSRQMARRAARQKTRCKGRSHRLLRAVGPRYERRCRRRSASGA
jgi:tRNA A37 methylthiotransferase MiaB